MWQWVSVECVAEVQGGIQKQPKRKPDVNAFPFLRVANVLRGRLDLSEVHKVELFGNEIERLRLQSGDILIVEGNGSPSEVGRMAVWQGEIEPCVHQNHIIRARMTGAARAIYFAHYWNSPEGSSNVAQVASSTSGLYTLSVSKVKKLHVPLPPLAEQDRIVSAIESNLTRLDAGVANLEKVRAKLKRYRAAVLKAACEGRLVPTEAELARAEGRHYEPADRLLDRVVQERRAQWEADQLAKMTAQGKRPKGEAWRSKYPEPSLPCLQDRAEIPEGWAWATVSQVSTLITDGDHNPPRRVAEGVPHLTARNIKNWRIYFEGCTFISESDFQQSRRRYLPQALDLIVTCVGTLGETAIVASGMTFSADRNLAAIRLVGAGLGVGMLQIVLNSPWWQSSLRQVSGSTAQPHLYLGDIREIVVPVPPTDEQTRIVAEVERRLSLIDELKAVVSANLKRAGRLRQAILKRAFEGKLVPQDPADEPASVLLERMKRARSEESGLLPGIVAGKMKKTRLG